MLICSQVFNHIDSNTDGHLQFDEFVAALVPSASANSDTTSTYYSGPREFVYLLHTFNSAELTNAVNSHMSASPEESGSSRESQPLKRTLPRATWLKYRD